MKHLLVIKIMKYKYFTIIILLFLFPSFLAAQLSYSGMLDSRYADSENNLGFNEHLFDINIDYSGADRSFQVWTQFEFSDPPELGRSVEELRKLRFEYSFGNITAKIGDIYEFWGMGMSLNQTDDQTIDLDTGVRGLSCVYENDFLKWPINKNDLEPYYDDVLKFLNFAEVHSFYSSSNDDFLD